MDIGSIRIVVVILMGIAVILFMIYLSTRSIVDAINHWGSMIAKNQLDSDDTQHKIIKEIRENR